MDSEKPAPASPSPGLRETTDKIGMGPTPANLTASPSPGLRDAVIDNHTASSLCEDNIRLRSLVGWISGWVTKPAASYSMLALDGFFASARDKIATLAAKEVETANPVSGLRDAVIEECAQVAHTYAVNHGFSISEANMQRDAIRALKSQEPT